MSACESVTDKQNMLKVLLERNVFFPGDIIRGRVVVNVTSPIRLTALRLRLAVKEWFTRETTAGSGPVFAEQRSPIYKQLLTLEGCTKQLTVAVEKVKASQLAMDTMGRMPFLTITKGKYFYPFEFQLPSWVPPTYQCEGAEGNYSAVVGFIKSYIEDPSAGSVDARCFFRIVGIVPQRQYYDLLSNMLQQSQKFAWTNFCCQARQVEVRVSCRNIVRLDQEKELVVRIEVMDPSYHVDGVKVRLEHVVHGGVQTRAIVADDAAIEVDADQDAFRPVVALGYLGREGAAADVPLTSGGTKKNKKSKSKTTRPDGLSSTVLGGAARPAVNFNEPSDVPCCDSVVSSNPLAPSTLDGPSSLKSHSIEVFAPALTGVRTFIAKLPLTNGITPTVIGLNLRSFYEVIVEIDVPYAGDPVLTLTPNIVQVVQSIPGLPTAAYIDVDRDVTFASRSGDDAAVDHISAYKVFGDTNEFIYRKPSNWASSISRLEVDEQSLLTASLRSSARGNTSESHFSVNGRKKSGASPLGQPTISPRRGRSAGMMPFDDSDWLSEDSPELLANRHGPPASDTPAGDPAEVGHIIRESLGVQGDGVPMMTFPGESNHALLDINGKLQPLAADLTQITLARLFRPATTTAEETWIARKDATVLSTWPFEECSRRY